MKQGKGRTLNNISKGVTSTRSKFKLSTTTTPIKNAPLTAKVNSNWNNVLNKNKDSASIGKVSSPHKFEINLATNDPVKTLRYFFIELKNKMDSLLPGNRTVKHIMENILKTLSQMEQPFNIQHIGMQRIEEKEEIGQSAHKLIWKTMKNSKSVSIQISNPQLTTHKTNDVAEFEQNNENFKENLVQENAKLKRENEAMELQLLTLKTELDESRLNTEKLQSTLNESVNSERETIANYEQQCKRLENEIKTLQDSTSRKECFDTSAVSQKPKLNRTIEMEKFKYQMQMAFKELEMEKLLAILKYDKNQMNASHSEFRNVYELLQKYFSSDQSQQMEIILNINSGKN